MGTIDTNSSTGAVPQVAKYPSPRNWQDFVDLLSRFEEHWLEAMNDLDPTFVL